jgi:hypothetical protein
MGSQEIIGKKNEGLKGIGAIIIFTLLLVSSHHD